METKQPTRNEIDAALTTYRERDHFAALRQALSLRWNQAAREIQESASAAKTAAEEARDEWIRLQFLDAKPLLTELK